MGVNGVPVPAVATVTVIMLANGQVKMNAQSPNIIVSLGMLESAKAMLTTQMLNPKREPEIEVAPPGLRIN